MNTQELNIDGTFARADKKEEKLQTGWFAKQVTAFENGRFAIMAAFLTIQSCIGSIAVMYLLKSDANELMLALCAAITMGANALLIAQAGAKTCVIAIYANILINSALILLYF